jgi:transposase
MKNNNTKKSKKLKAQTMIVTVDIGKTTQWGYFRAPDGSDVEPFAFTNTNAGFHEFWFKIKSFYKSHGLKHIMVGFESSGPYAEPLFHFLMNKPVELVQVNPLHTKRVKELTGNSPNKTDKKDPRVIADIIGLGHALSLIVPQGAAANLRRLAHARERCLKKRTQAKNQLHDTVFILFPEFISIMKNISTKTAMFLLEHYPTPKRMAALSIDDLTATLRKLSRGRIGQERAIALLEAANNSIGIKHGKQAIEMELKELITEISNLNQSISKYEQQMHPNLLKIPYSRSILSIKGISTLTAAGLIGEVSDFKKFNTIAEVIKLAGLDLYEISSGRHKGKRRISKRGRPLMRKLLYFAAINTVKTNGIMHDRYQRMLARGMIKMKALTAIMRQLLTIIFAIVRDDALFIENYPGKPEYKLAA